LASATIVNGTKTGVVFAIGYGAGGWDETNAYIDEMMSGKRMPRANAGTRRGGDDVGTQALLDDVEE
jgi:hypothetical protein